MQTQKNSLAVISTILLTVISSINILISIISVHDPTKQIATVLMGAVVVLAVSFLKEEYLYKSASLIYICAIALMIVQLIFGKDSSYAYRRYLYLCGFAIYTAAILPLISFQVSKSITKYTRLSINSFAVVSGLVLIPLTLIFFQTNLTPVIIAMVVIAVGAVILKLEGRLNITWRAFIIPILLLGILVVGLYDESDYFADRIDIIITRGACDPFSGGWVRIVLDSIFKSTPFIGKTTYAIEGQNVVGTLAKWADHNIVIVLAEYGWLAFIVTLLVYVGFFICLFKMVSKTRQSSFARYTSLFLSLSLVAQTIYSLLGVFLLAGASLNLPFMSGHTVNMMSYLSFGIILMLYIKRDQPSTIQELEVDETQNKPSFIKRFISVVTADKEFDEEI